MHRTILITTALLVSACASTSEQRKPEPRFQVQIESPELEYVLARTIALQYLSNVSWYDYDGGNIEVKKCDGTESSQCHYYVSHIGNGCGWGSYVIEQCKSGKCTYSFSPYDVGSVICE